MNDMLRMPAVKKRTGLARSTIYQRMKENTFPASVSLGVRAVGWKESDIETWVQKRFESTQAKRNGVIGNEK